jgi:circadian clock protein KaiC
LPGLLTVHAARPSRFGLEMHLIRIYRMIDELSPAAVIVDPPSSLIGAGAAPEIRSVLVRLLDHLKTRQITAVFTSLANPGAVEESEIGVSSLIDTWLQVRVVESAGERNRAVYVIKSRGMGHSNQVREFLITDRGVELVEVQTGPAGVLVGSARLTQAADEAAAKLGRRQEAERKRRALRRRRAVVGGQIASLRADLAAEEDELATLTLDEETRTGKLRQERSAVERLREGASAPKVRARARPRAAGAVEPPPPSAPRRAANHTQPRGLRQ